MIKAIMNRRRAIAALGVATAVAFAAPAMAGTKINLGVLRLTSHSPNYIAFERGYFAAEGFDVELKYFQSSAAMAVAVAREWKGLILPGIAVGLFGYAVGNYLGFAVANLVRVLGIGA